MVVRSGEASVNEHRSFTRQVCAASSTNIGGLAAPEGRSMTANVRSISKSAKNADKEMLYLTLKEHKNGVLSSYRGIYPTIIRAGRGLFLIVVFLFINLQ